MAENLGSGSGGRGLLSNAVVGFCPVRAIPLSSVPSDDSPLLSLSSSLPSPASPLSPLWPVSSLRTSGAIPEWLAVASWSVWVSCDASELDDDVGFEKHEVSFCS